MPRLHVPAALAAGLDTVLPPNATRHVQVLRLQPGAELCLFDGSGGEWRAEVRAIGRREVVVRALAHASVERELARAVTLALGMPANERMDTLVEKATELGATAIQPLVCERSVLRVAGERAERKAAHWQAIVIAACEQCGRNRVPTVHAPLPLREWLESRGDEDSGQRLLLSLDADARPLAAARGDQRNVTFLSGPEGGLTEAEQAFARQRGFEPVSLGARVLRAETAPLAALAVIAALEAAA
ncbi:16S rRNA (uracil(1498)-N(3))-methyltransferase [Pseudaquabacterium terrae]|uniref:16S rRNA (uracil(1498)-N(3))-methyltransferase n=1 Tax=Pseudaquabacterium terrae TaxID=2732868 RepID=UPI003CCDD280